MADGVRLAIVGATGAVGQEMLKVLAERNFNIKELICLADPSEEGTKVRFKGDTFTVRGATPEAFKEADLALFAVGTDISRQLAPEAVKHNCVVIDNSYAFRLEKKVPLVVPEVNPDDIYNHQGIIANPNCSTIIMVVALNPLHRAAGLTRVIVSTYQAVSGAGKAGIEELKNQAKSYLNGQEIVPGVFQHPIAFNLIPHIDVFMDEGYTREEMKMVWESRKILHCPELAITSTTVRVPVFRSHSESINLETEKELTVAEVRDILGKAPGVIVQDDPDNNVYPMPLYTSDSDEVYVGRIRKDLSARNGIALWVAGDQLRKGAATNAVQIASIVAEHNLY